MALDIAARLLRYQQVEARYGFPRATLRCWVSRGKIPHIRFGKRLVYFDPAAIDAWIAAHSQPVGGRP